jgi:glutathione S-transferase
LPRAAIRTKLQQHTFLLGEYVVQKIEIIGVPFSNFVWVVRMVCEEKGVPYDLTPAPPHSPQVDAIHPLGKIPVMRHGDVTLCESKAIATYIDRTFNGPKVIPEDPKAAAETEKWVSLINAHMDPVMIRQYVLNYAFPKGADGKPDRKAIDASLPDMQKQIGILDQAVAKTGYLAGASFTLADMDLMPILHYVQMFPEGKTMMADAKSLTAYFAKHAERPCFKATIPEPPPPPRPR